MTEKQEKILNPRKPAPCRPVYPYPKVSRVDKTPRCYDALPRDSKFVYMPPGYYATGFRFSEVYKTKVDFSEYRNLLFFEDPKQAKKWGALKARIPYPEGRITDLPGTREVHYRNYCIRSLTPESASSWRKSIRQPYTNPAEFGVEENQPEEENKPEAE